MTEKETGGSAFPCRSEKNEHGVEYQAAELGMTLRDWFAGQALSGLLSRGFTTDISADIAYKAADEMIKRRKE